MTVSRILSLATSPPVFISPCRSMRRVLLVALLVVLATPVARAQEEADYFAIRKNFTLFSEIYERLAGEYVDRIDAESLMRSGIAAMTGSLDPYTVFFDEATSENIRRAQGEGVGTTGLSVARRGERLVVVQVMEGSPAEAQGVRPGDAIVELAGRPVANLDAEAARAQLRGQPGAPIEIHLAREGTPEVLRFVLVRTEADREDVTFAGFTGNPAEGVGMVRLDRFAHRSADQVVAAIERLREERELKALVLDLRGNPGGLLDQAVELSGLFLPQDSEVVSTEGRSTNSSSVYRTPRDPIAPDLPVAVLVDRRSASASEIVAGALQDHDRAVIVGERTFGKGLVQVVRPLAYGTALKMTVARYATPSGRFIQAVAYRQGKEAGAVTDADRPVFETAAGRAVHGGGGIDPDVMVPLGTPSDLEEALTRTAAFLRFANRYAADHPQLPEGFSVDEVLLEDFRAFVENDGLDYRTEAERRADALAETIEADGYDVADDELEALRRAVTEAKARDFERHAPRLMSRLQQEILSRYVAGDDLTRGTLAEDPVLKRALEVLRDEERYREILGG